MKVIKLSQDVDKLHNYKIFWSSHSLLIFEISSHLMKFINSLVTNRWYKQSFFFFLNWSSACHLSKLINYTLYKYMLKMTMYIYMYIFDLSFNFIYIYRYIWFMFWLSPFWANHKPVLKVKITRYQQLW